MNLEPKFLKPKDDNDRLNNLELAYTLKTAEAIRTGKLRTVATMDAICKLALVDPTYAYGHKNPSEKDLGRYKAFQKKVNDFAKDFKQLQKESENEVEENKDVLKAAREQLFKLAIEKNDLINKYQKLLKQNKNLESEALETQLTNTASSSRVNENTINVICPDDTLTYNDQYNFYNNELREKAWNEARAKFQKLMKRKIAQRVFLLVGIPCSGKSTWIEKRELISDRHAVIIDATNLTKGDRAEWIMLARKCADIKIRAVLFLTDFSTIKSRNSQRRNQGKYIDVSILEAKEKNLQLIDVRFEDFDEIEIIRED